MREFVVQRRLMSQADFLSGLALSQALPGINVVNLSIWIGYRLLAGPGALVATLGMVLPPLLLAIFMLIGLEQLTGSTLVPQVMAGIAAAAIGLSLEMGVRSARSAATTSAGSRRWPQRGITPWRELAIVVRIASVLDAVPVDVLVLPVRDAVAVAVVAQGVVAPRDLGAIGGAVRIGVGRERVAKHRFIGVRLRQPLAMGLPRRAVLSTMSFPAPTIVDRRGRTQTIALKPDFPSRGPRASFIDNHLFLPLDLI